MNEEIPVSFLCQADWLYGILHLVERSAQRGVVFVVGGPQYRVGSHRQFVLMAREIAKTGTPVLRFDYRGMGDSDGKVGEPEPCEHLNGDIRCAIDCLLEQVPSIREIVVLGLCDGASAAMLYGYSDKRVTGMVLLNPWVSTETGAAKAYMKDYYLKRLTNPDFWRKVVNFELNLKESGSYFLRKLVTAFKAKEKNNIDVDESAETESTQWVEALQAMPLNDRVAASLEKFKGRVLLVLSGNDLIASEFKSLLNTSRKWRSLMQSPNVTRHDFAEADHTFSTRGWHNQVMEWVLHWLEQQPPEIRN